MAPAPSTVSSEEDENITGTRTACKAKKIQLATRTGFSQWRRILVSLWSASYELLFAEAESCSRGGLMPVPLTKKPLSSNSFLGIIRKQVLLPEHVILIRS